MCIRGWGRSVFIFLLWVSAWCSGCVKNPWDAYYTALPVSEGVQVTLCDSVEMIRRDDLDPNIFFELFEKGYAPIGYAEFNGTENYLDEAAIAAQARKNGACVCYYGARYSHTEAGLDISSGLPTGVSGAAVAAPLQLAQRKQDMFDYLAIYAGKDATDRALGILAAVMPEEYGKKLKTEAGLIVLAVRKGSRADEAGIRRGDVLVFLGGKPVTRTTLEAWSQPSGKPVPLILYRHGSPVKVYLGAP